MMIDNLWSLPAQCEVQNDVIFGSRARDTTASIKLVYQRGALLKAFSKKMAAGDVELSIEVLF